MLITEKKLTDVVVNMQCDCCNKINNDQLLIEHRFGYDSACDGVDMEFTICDDCLLLLVLYNIKAKFTDGFEKVNIDIDKLKARLKAKINKDENWINLPVYEGE